jgi:hypothetical protein
MATYPTFALTGLAIQKIPVLPNVTVQETISGKEIRIGHSSTVRWRYRIPIEMMTASERTAFYAFLTDAGGALTSFTITDPDTAATVTVRLEDPGVLTRLFQGGWGDTDIGLIEVL